jgi:aspartyl-tRNA(Asn)/glutamyl-tRNA(Gln) amidotransferase subunit C
MKIDEKLIKHVAEIARLDLSKKEINKFIPEFKEILDIFSEIDKVEIKNDPGNVLTTQNKLRSDNVEPSLEKKEVFLNTSHKEESFFKGPKIK